MPQFGVARRAARHAAHQCKRQGASATAAEQTIHNRTGPDCPQLQCRPVATGAQLATRPAELPKLAASEGHACVRVRNGNPPPHSPHSMLLCSQHALPPAHEHIDPAVHAIDAGPSTHSGLHVTVTAPCDGHEAHACDTEPHACQLCLARIAGFRRREGGGAPCPGLPSSPARCGG